MILDPYAQMFLDAVGDSIPNLYVNEEDLTPELAEIDPRLVERMRAMRGYIASRTLFFDEFFLAAANAGVRQAVIPASGLDARAWRLDWPAGCAVYELDQPKVLDPAEPTAWSAEGLLPYLAADAQDMLFDGIASLSAPGSRVAVEDFTSDFFSAQSLARQEEQMQRYRKVASRTGLEDLDVLGDLLYREERVQVVDWLTARGWQATGVSAPDLMARNGRQVAADLEDSTPQSVYVEGRLPS